MKINLNGKLSWKARRNLYRISGVTVILMALAIFCVGTLYLSLYGGFMQFLSAFPLANDQKTDYNLVFGIGRVFILCPAITAIAFCILGFGISLYED